MKKKSIFFGALALTISGIISKFVGAFYRIPLLSILGSEGLGMYQLVFPIFTFILVLSSSGVSLTLSSLVSKYEKNNEHTKSQKLFYCATIEITIVCIIISILYVLLGLVVSPLQGNLGFKSYYVCLAPAIIFSGIIACIKGYYQGLNDMIPSSIVQIFEQVFKLFFGIGLAIFFQKKSLYLSVLGALLGITIAEFFSMLTIIFLHKKRMVLPTKIKLKKGEKVEYLKVFNKQLLPIVFTNTISPFFMAIQSVIIVGLLSNAGFNNSLATRLFGINNGMISSIVALPTVLSTAISTSIVPLINLSDKSSANSIIKLSYKIIFFFCFPIAILFIMFGNEVAGFLYNSLSISGVDQIYIAGSLLKINGINTFYMSFISLSTCILQVKNESRIAIKNLLIGNILKLFLCIFLVSNSRINIYGLAISEVVGLSLICVLNMRRIKKLYPIRFTIKEGVFVPIFSSLFTIVVMKLLRELCYSSFPTKVDFLALLFIGVVIYLSCLIVLKTFSKAELKEVYLSKKSAQVSVENT